MQLGVHIGQQNMTMNEMRDIWKRADAAGADWISVWDHLYEAPPQGGTVDHFEAVACLGALAADTHRARLGCLVFYVGYRNPGLLAKAAVTIDHISGGRFELGIGAGWHEWEAEAYGYDFPSVGKRLDMLDEAAGLINSFYDNDRTTHSGRVLHGPRGVDAAAPGARSSATVDRRRRREAHPSHGRPARHRLERGLHLARGVRPVVRRARPALRGDRPRSGIDRALDQRHVRPRQGRGAAARAVGARCGSGSPAAR